jgi:DNA uptake protein ComE-like DNA-binding protein
MPPSLGLSGEETPIDSSPEPIVPLTAVQQENAPKRLNLNTASKAELESIDLIGPATAKRLIAGRPYELLDQAREASLMPEAQWQQIEALLEVK